MIVDSEVLLIHPAWGLLFLMSYVFSFYIFLKTEGNIFLSAISLCVWSICSAAIIYWYYGIPFTGGF